MNRSIRHWPLMTGVLLILLAGGGRLLRSSRVVSLQPASTDAVDPIESLSQSRCVPSLDKTRSVDARTLPAKIARQENGASLRIHVTADALYILGELLVFRDDNRIIFDQELRTEEASAEIDCSFAEVGTMSVVLIPLHSFSPVSERAEVREGGPNFVSLHLRKAKPFSGHVLDGQRRPLKDALVSVVVPHAFCVPVEGTEPGPLHAPILQRDGRRNALGHPPSCTPRSDGSLCFHAYTDESGAFALVGIAGSSLELTVVCQEVAVTQAFATESEATIILPMLDSK